MTTFNLLLIALIQGVTEFLPISSSGHLILLPSLTGLADQGQIIDVAAHVGTLMAVILYFWSDVRKAAYGTLRLLRGKVDTQGAFLALCLLIATIPVVLFGLFLKLTGLSDAMRGIAVIGWAMIIFGIVLYWADQKGPMVKPAEAWSLKDALKMGLWQAVALIPGTSRSGITITAGRMLGYQRTDAARLSMLMSIPTIIASAAILSLDVVGAADASALRDIGIVVAMSFAAALLALTLMMRLLRAVSYTPYVIYRIALGIVLLWIAYT
ncbi:undecaprenyl-diphosphate phosphatase [Yoonia sediminilitoris]|uniref:Undecaprenyl-diphosphatase n=1 Tax=Yoonia sediminilitoris TaxID=1286148 RepID=A0A2T6KLD0_9RHOB|nr:undecaprenyl-diphosphate phosphatase [Yoonia sediminilitoris]PUB16994.1 undecaprenyl-diphosphatase [Yoonia sediminilitoris]RCW97289.1 undecaprenyl-diphosphatase [Yoonia sediminilitoris]